MQDNSNNIKHNHGPFIFLLVIYLISLLFTVSPILRELRYIKYAVAFMAPFFLLPKRVYFRHLDTFYLRNFYLYLSIILISLCNIYVKGNLYQIFFEESVFIITPILFAFFLFRYYDPLNREYYIKFLFWGIVITYIILQFRPDRGAGSYFVNPIDLFLAVDKPKGIASHGFYLGFFVLYFAYKKNLRYFIYSLFFFVLTAKRISISALILIYFLYLFNNKSEITPFKKFVIPLVMTALNLLLSYLIYNFTLGDYNDFILNYTGVYPGDITTGRYWIYKVYVEQYNFSWLGDGIGKVTQTISEYYGMKFNFHSDILKNYMEFGPIIFSIWIYFYYRLNTKNILSLFFLLYTNILFISDNAFTYFDILFLLYFFLGQSHLEELSDEEQKQFT